MKEFFVVIRNKEQTAITRRHETLLDARDEAERLCKKEGDKFIILHAVAAVSPLEPAIRWTLME